MAITLGFNLGALTQVAAPSVLVLTLIVALALVPMVAHSTSLATAGLRVIGVAALYTGLHWAAQGVFLVPALEETSLLAWTIVALGFAVLFAAQSLVGLRPLGRLSQTLHTWLFAGLYLDEAFTRLTFRVWPPRLAGSTPHHKAPVLASAMASEETPS